MIKYLLKRKKNIILFFVLGLINKVLIHYLFFPITIRPTTGRYKDFLDGPLEWSYYYGEPYRDTIGAHIEVIFTSDNRWTSPELHLFIPAYLLIGFFAWYFSDNIKAR